MTASDQIGPCGGETWQPHVNRPGAHLCRALDLEATGPPKAKRAPARVGDSIPLPVHKANATAEGGSKKGPFYKPLPKEFRRDGFYRQIAREGNAAIYEQRWTGCAEPSVCYEVIRIHRREAFQIGVRLVEPAEVYPKSEAWGLDGWTVLDKETAFRKLREIVSASQKESANPVKKSPIQNTKRCSETKKLCGDVKRRRDG